MHVLVLCALRFCSRDTTYVARVRPNCPGAHLFACRLFVPRAGILTQLRRPLGTDPKLHGSKHLCLDAGMHQKERGMSRTKTSGVRIRTTSRFMHRWSRHVCLVPIERPRRPTKITSLPCLQNSNTRSSIVHHWSTAKICPNCRRQTRHRPCRLSSRRAITSLYYFFAAIDLVGLV